MSVLIAIEGIDGAGKGTQCDLLIRWAEEQGLRSELFSFPQYGANPFAEAIAAYLNGQFGPVDHVPAELAALLYAGDRLATRDALVAALGSCDLVICDRYVASNLAHQAAKMSERDRSSFTRWLTAIEYGVHRMPVPALNVWLDMPLDVAEVLVRRKKPRNYTQLAADIHEQDRDFLSASHAVFRVLCERGEGGEWARIVCGASTFAPRDATEIALELRALVQQRLPVDATVASRR